MHGYGSECSSAKLVTGIWRLPISDIIHHLARLKFYITPGDRLILLGNEIFSKSYLLGPENLLRISANAMGISDQELNFMNYSEQIGPPGVEGVRSYLLVVPCKTASFRCFFSSEGTRRVPKSLTTRFKDGRVAKRFAIKLRRYSHFHPEDMLTLCKRGGVLTPVLKRVFYSTFDSCSICKSTGRPHSSRKISFGKILVDFNEHVQVDFFFMQEMENEPVLDMVDIHTGLSQTAVTRTRRIAVAAEAFESLWINQHGAPRLVSGDPEFFNNSFANQLAYFRIKFQPRPSRAHNKIGVVDRKNAIIRHFAQKLFKEAFHARDTRGTTVNNDAIIARATYLSNVLFASKTLSSFELSRGYCPQMQGLQNNIVTTELRAAHDEQVARRAIYKLIKSKAPQTLSSPDITRNDKVYFHKRNQQGRGSWFSAFVRKPEDHYVVLSTSLAHAGKDIKAAYEHVRLAPTNTLLQELDSIEFLFPRSYSLLDADHDDHGSGEVTDDLAVPEEEIIADAPPSQEEILGAVPVPDDPPPSPIVDIPMITDPHPEAQHSDENVEMEDQTHHHVDQPLHNVDDFTNDLKDDLNYLKDEASL